MRTYIQMGAMVAMVVGLALVGPSAAVAAPMSGAIWTTDAGGHYVDKNIYDSKCDVYLNGGSSKGSGNGLPDGQYHVQVTEPDGTVLGTSVAPGNPAPILVVDGRFASSYPLCDVVFMASDLTQKGYDDTMNPGGEYKVWVSQNGAFPNNASKTDNFKVKEQSDPVGTLVILKFYDANANGTWDLADPLEIPLPGWRIGATNIATGYSIGERQETPWDGEVPAGDYKVCELLPQELNWMPTTPMAQIATVRDGRSNPSTAVKFGNVCFAPVGAHTLGYWANKGQGLIDGDQLCVLTGLNLKDATGRSFDPVKTCPPSAGQITTGKTALRTWMLTGNAKSMAYMLSVQLTAMQLNVLNGLVKYNAVIYAPGTRGANAMGFARVCDVMKEANDSLGGYPNTPAGSPERVHQEAVKDALDDANNDLTFVSSVPGPRTFAN